MALSPLARLLSGGRSSSGHLLLPAGKFPAFIALRHLSSSPLPRPEPPDSSPIPSLSARLSFVFDQIDAIDRDRAAKDEALQRIRSWRQSRAPPPQRPRSSEDSDSSPPSPSPLAAPPTSTPFEARDFTAAAVDGAEKEESMRDVFRKELELVHPWPEWIELMERLGQQNYFDFRGTDEERIAENVGIDLSAVKDETGLDFSRDWITVRNACMNFGRDRFDILKSLSRKDLQVLVGYGCPSMDPKVVFSAKLLRKLVHLDEGDVCSSCNLRSSCSRGYILTRKEDEARTLDVMRILLTYGFDHINGSVENKSLMKIKSLKTVIRKLLHEVVKLSAVPIDPNLPPPVIKKPPLKVKQPPPPPKKRVGRDDVEMKKGDWLCTKCDFMNFAKNTVCLQCDAKRPKRQLLPGEWECPQCNFLNYRRNMACFHCDHKRPPDDYTENEMQMKQPGPRTGRERNNRIQDISNAWNFDFDDNESDGADVATHEFADSPKSENQSHAGFDRGFQGGTEYNGRTTRISARDRYFNNGDDGRKAASQSDRTGFDDFDDEEDDVDSYELDGSNCSQTSQVSRRSYSELEKNSESEDFDEHDQFTKLKQRDQEYLSGSDDDNLAEHPYWRSSHARDSKQEARGRGNNSPLRKMSFVSDDDDELDSDFDDDTDDVLASRKGRDHKKSVARGRQISDSDDGDRDGNFRIQNKSASGGSRKEVGTFDRRKSWTSSNSPSRGGSSMHKKSSPRDGYSRFRENEEYQNFNRSRNKNESKFRQPGRSRGSPRSDGYGRFRENEEYQNFNRFGSKNEPTIRQPGRSRNSPRGDGYGNKNEPTTRQPYRSRNSPRGDGYGRFRENEEYRNFNRLGNKNESRIRQQPGRSRGSPRSQRNFDEDRFD